MKATNLALVLTFVVSGACLAASAEDSPRPLAPADYAADQKCLSCHADKQSYPETAHSLTSRAPAADTIKGRFDAGHDKLETSMPDVSYRMERKKDGFYETLLVGQPRPDVWFSKRIDVVIGSGRKGQTYLYWADGDRLCELPVSYWTELDAWVNSPGYADTDVNFRRPVTPRCLECHASTFESVPDAAVNRYRTAGYVLGISCAKCHGPGREHVALRTAKAAPVPGREIVNPAKLARARQIDVCALCHGGAGTQRAPVFSFVPGRSLDDYVRLAVPPADASVDVHGNQIALLERSRCFQGSDMTCSTCHDVHRPQRDAAAFSSACLTCHKPESCGMFPTAGRKIADDCVDCHMPKQTSNVLFSMLQGRRLQPLVRTHWIKAYPVKGGT